MEAKLRKGDIITGIHGDLIEILSADSFRYLISKVRNTNSPEISSTNLLSWNYQHYRWRLTETSVVDRILEKYNNL